MKGREGQVLAGVYQLNAFVGRGGMADVYKAFDQERRATVAVKVLQPHLATNPETVSGFVREAQALERLDHPHIVRFYGLNARTTICSLSWIGSTASRCARSWTSGAGPGPSYHI